MMFALISLLFVSASWAWHVNWTYPDDNSHVFNVLDTVYVTWQSNTVVTSMNLWCYNVKSHQWEPPLLDGLPWSVDSTGSFQLQFYGVTSKYQGGCHLGIYNQSGPHVTVPSIQNSPNFHLSFNLHTSRQTWGKKFAYNRVIVNSGAASAPLKTGVKNKPASSDNTLSTGAQVGIGIGAAIGVIAIVALIYLFWRLRSKWARKSHKSPFDEALHHSAATGEKTLVSSPAYPRSPELSVQKPQYIYEVDGDSKLTPSELDGTPRSELSSQA